MYVINVKPNRISRKRALVVKICCDKYTIYFLRLLPTVKTYSRVVVLCLDNHLELTRKDELMQYSAESCGCTYITVFTCEYFSCLYYLYSMSP